MAGRISFFGDLHPSFAGNVVKAMASAKQGYPVVSRVLARRTPRSPLRASLIGPSDNELRAVVQEVIRLTPNIVEVVVQAPMAARAFEPGQFYRLQNYETLAPRANGHRAGDGGPGADRRVGGSRKGTALHHRSRNGRLVRSVRAAQARRTGDPDGADRHAHRNALAGDGAAGGRRTGQRRAVLDRPAAARAGSRAIYFAGYKKIIDRYKVEEIEKAADVVVWCCDEAPGFTPDRVQDKAFVGKHRGSDGRLRPRRSWATSKFRCSSVDRLMVIGSDAMMRAVQRARHTVLPPYLKPDHKAIGSINSPMQCMMKEICAQCLQQHKDPVTGEETVVFSCFNQDQPLDHVDFGSLRTRLSQNGVQEKLTKQWIDHCLRRSARGRSSSSAS